MNRPITDRMLAGRYEILRQVSICGETVVYLGRDCAVDQRVTIREFFADTIMTRGADGVISVLPGREVQYKSLSSDYEELCNDVMALAEQKGVLCPDDVFWENNTVYSVEHRVVSETLDDYLARCGGRLTWQQLKKAVAPVVAAVSRLHAEGFYHRGISPETIMVDGDGRFLLTGFCIPAARTAGSEVSSTLYFGYSAPEQYASSSWQGSWTDVYSLGAVCYRALTGTTPVEWRQRGQGRTLVPARAIEQSVPETVSNALMIALSVELNSRYRSVEEFWIGMLHGPGDGTATYQLPVVEKRADPPPRRRAVHPALAVGGLMLLVLVLSLNLVTFIIDRYVGPPLPPASTASSEAESRPSSPSEAPPPKERIVVPNWAGIGVDKIMQDETNARQFRFEVEWIYSEIEPTGSVVSTDPAAGTVMEEEGELVVLVVSKGSETIAMPKVVGLTRKEATAELDKASIRFVIEPVDDPDSPEDTVVDASVAEGAVVYRSTTIVMLQVASRM